MKIYTKTNKERDETKSKRTQWSFVTCMYNRGSIKGRENNAENVPVKVEFLQTVNEWEREREKPDWLNVL